MPLGETDLEFARIMDPLPKYVVSHGYDPADANTEVIGAAEVAGIVEAADGPVLMLAGGALAGELREVIDEIFLLVGPIVLGSGQPLLDVTGPVPTRLLTARASGSSSIGVPGTRRPPRSASTCSSAGSPRRSAAGSAQDR